MVFQTPAANHSPAQVERVKPFDVLWNRPIFRPPSLPTQAQIWNEIPFTARLFSKAPLKK